ncbi:unnamed protein product, partial [Porites evermanni]
VRTLEGFKFSCWAKGSPPIYTALIRENTVLVNTSETASIQLDQEGNYSCVATSDQGKDTKEFSVSFTDCGPDCRYYSSYNYGNYITCKSFSYLSQCAPVITETL